MEFDKGNGQAERRERPVLLFEGAGFWWTYQPHTDITVAELAQAFEFLQFSQAVAMKAIPPGLLDDFWLHHMEDGARRHFWVAVKSQVLMPGSGGLGTGAGKYRRGA